MNVKKGDPVEFTRDYRQSYTLGTGEYGIAIEDETPRGVRVEMADGSIVLAEHIHACSWGGWLPEDLEDAFERHNPPEDLYGDY
jgi:hypothetical protein